MKTRVTILALALAAAALSGCGTVGESMSMMGLDNPFDGSDPRGNPYQAQAAPQDDWGAANFQAWSPQTPDYLLFPGDTLSITVPSAPELSRDVVIGPDGRFSFPYAGAVMAANRSTLDVSQSLTNALARDLRRPYVEISPAAFGSQKILVLGQVKQPGMFDLPGPMGALEAVAMAGGFEDGANTREVSIIRRAANGRPMRKEVNLGATLRGVEGGDYDVLARYDIVYVPRSGIASAGLFVQQYLRDIIPFNVGFSYALNGDGDNDDINAFASTN